MKINLIWKMVFLIGICQGLTVSQDTFPEENHAAIQERAADLSNVFLIQVSCSDKQSSLALNANHNIESV